MAAARVRSDGLRRRPSSLRSRCATFPASSACVRASGAAPAKCASSSTASALFRHDLTVEEVTQRVRAKIQGLVPTALVEGSTRTDIRVRLREDDRGTLRDLMSLDISAPGRNVLPLAVVLKGEPIVAEGPGEIRRVGGRHAAIITAAYEGLALDKVAAQADDRCRHPVAQTSSASNTRSPAVASRRNSPTVRCCSRCCSPCSSSTRSWPRSSSRCGSPCSSWRRSR